MKKTTRKGGVKRDGKGMKRDEKGMKRDVKGMKRDAKGMKRDVIDVRNMKSTRRDTLVIPMIGRNRVETKIGGDMTLIEQGTWFYFTPRHLLSKLTCDEPIHY